jgi:hypothetical protein
MKELNNLKHIGLVKVLVLVNETISAGQTVQKFKEEFIESYERINELFSD